MYIMQNLEVVGYRSPDMTRGKTQEWQALESKDFLNLHDFRKENMKLYRYEKMNQIKLMPTLPNI